MKLAPVNPTSSAEADSIWFPVRITAAPGGGVYGFQEVWAITGGTVADKVGGRVNAVATDPAYAIDGSTFATTAAGSAVQVLARRADGIGGVGWELKGFSGEVPTGSGLVVPIAATISTTAVWTTVGSFFFPGSTLGNMNVMLTVPAFVTAPVSSRSSVIGVIEASDDGVSWTTVSEQFLLVQASGFYGTATDVAAAGTISFLLARTSVNTQCRIRAILYGDVGSAAQIPPIIPPTALALNATGSFVFVSG